MKLKAPDGPTQANEANAVNERTRYMMVGAVIAIVSGTLSAAAVAWGLRGGEVVMKASVPAPRVGVSHPSESFVPRPPTLSLNPSAGATRSAYQQAQNRPEVKEAHEAYLEAQKKYVVALQSAMGKQPGPVVPPTLTKPPALPDSTTTNPSVRVRTQTSPGR
jgi:hypothetical protein